MRYIKAIITVGIWIILLWYCGNALEKNAIPITNLISVVPLIAILYLFNNFIRSEFINEIYKTYGFSIKRINSFLSVFIASSLNFIVPFKIGSVYRAVYLKNVHDFGYDKFVSGHIGFTVYATIATLILTIAAMFWIGFRHSKWDMNLLLILVIILIAILCFVEFSKRVRIRIKFALVENFIDKMSSGVSQIFHHKRLLITAILSIIALTVSNGLALYLVLNIMESDTGLIALCLLALTQTLAGMLSLTPGSVGIQEAAGLLIHEIISISPENVILAVFSIRVIKILTIGLLIYPAHLLLIKSSKSGN